MKAFFRQSWRRKFVSLWLITFFLGIFPVIATIQAEEEISGSIEFKSGILQDLVITDRPVDKPEAFRFEWLGNRMDLEIFFNATLEKWVGQGKDKHLENVTKLWSLRDFEDDFGVTVEYLVNMTSPIQFGWIVNDTESITNSIHEAWFKIEDTQPFDIEDIELETLVIPELPYNITEWHLPDGLDIRFDNLRHKGFNIEEVNKDGIKLTGFGGKRNWNLDPITYSPDIVTITGYSSGYPCTPRVIYDADVAGSRTILTNASATTDMNTIVRPAGKALTLNITTSQVTSSGWCNLTGVAIDESVQTEEVAISANTTYTTSLFWKSIDTDGIDCDFVGYVEIVQPRWGIISHNEEVEYYGTHYGYSYTIWSTKIDVGDGSTASYFGFQYGVHSAYSSKLIFFDTTGFATYTRLIQVKNNGDLRLGLVLNEDDKSTRKSNMLSQGGGGTSYYVYVLSGGVVNAYGTTFHAGLYRSQTGGKIWSCYFEGTIIEGAGTFDIKDTSVRLSGYPTFGVTIISENFAIYRCTRMYFIRYGSGSNYTLQNMYGRRNTYICTWQSSGNNLVALNWDVDSWAFAFGTNDGQCYRQYSYDITVTYLNGTVVNGTSTGARVTIQHYGTAQDVDYNETLSESGTITTQNLTMGVYNKTGGNTIYDFNPFNIQITNLTGYQDYDANFTFSGKTDWTIALLEDIVTETDPVARFSFSPSNPRPQQTVSFDGTESSDPDGGSLSSYSWAFGDGNSDTGNTTTHTYTTDGDYNVTLTVTDDEAVTDSFSQTVTVLLGGTSTRIPAILEVALNPISPVEPSLLNVWWDKSSSDKAYVTVVSLMDSAQDVEVAWWITSGGTTVCTGNRTVQVDSFYPTVTATIPFTLPLNEPLLPVFEETYVFHATATVLGHTSNQISMPFDLSATRFNSDLLVLVLAVVVVIIGLIVAIQRLRHKLHPEE